jgi:hypothetical protein
MIAELRWLHSPSLPWLGTRCQSPWNSFCVLRIRKRHWTTQKTCQLPPFDQSIAVTKDKCALSATEAKLTQALTPSYAHEGTVSAKWREIFAWSFRANWIEYSIWRTETTPYLSEHDLTNTLVLAQACKLKDRITPQVNFFQSWAAKGAAGTGKEGKGKEVVIDRKFKEITCLLVYN